MNEGRVAFIIGATTDIGRFLTEKMSQQGFAIVAVPHCTSHSVIHELNQVVRNSIRIQGRTIACSLDVSTQEGAEGAVQKAIDTFGRLDILIACVPDIQTKSLSRITEQQWLGGIEKNLRTTFNCFKVASQWMSTNNSQGRLIGIMSATGLVGYNFGQIHQAALVNSICGMIRAMAVELRHQQITVNSIAYSNETDNASKLSPLIQFLLSAESSNITGQIILINQNKISTIRTVESAGAIDLEDNWTKDKICSRWIKISR